MYTGSCVAFVIDFLFVDPLMINISYYGVCYRSCLVWKAQLIGETNCLMKNAL